MAKKSKSRKSTAAPVDEAPNPHAFEFELDRAIRDQVIEKLESSPFVPLVKDGAPPASGVYVLYLGDTLVYIGKASRETTASNRTLRDRLNEHVVKISGRQNLAISEMQCRYLTIESDWFVWAAEFALINHYDPEWNGTGFGSKAPGKGRPGTNRVSNWDRKYPPNKSRDIDQEQHDSE